MLQLVVEVDSHFAWMVTFSSFFMQFLTIGYLKSSGILLKTFQKYFNCSTTIVIAMTSSTFSLIALLSPLYIHLEKYIHLRFIVCAISILLCALWIFLSFNFTLLSWIICIIVIGILLSGTYGGVICKVIQSFDKYKDVAISVSTAGSSVGCILVPYLITYLVKVFHVTGIALLLGAYFLHYIIIGVTLPTEIVQAPHSKPSDKQRTLSTCSDGIGLSIASITDHVDNETKTQHSIELTKKQKYLGILFCIASTLSNVGFTTQYLIFPLFAAEIKINSNTTAILMSTQALCDLIVRLIIGWIADKVAKQRKPIVLIAGKVIMGLSCVCCVIIVFSYTTPQVRLISITVYCIMAGIGGGIYVATNCTVLDGYVGTSHFPRVYSLVLVCWGCCTVPSQILIGYISDVTKSLWWAQIICGSCMLLSSAIIGIEQWINLKNRNQHNKNLNKQQIHLLPQN